ncbi:MAG: hypothetical protein OEL87_03285 [Nanoarchaeota archaeon]|nr:hypothetical protein [Nanoarchaeota archaeon]
MVRAIMIVEMAGRPAAHLTESLEKHIGILNEVKDITVHSIKVSEPKEISREDLPQGAPQEDVMFTAFAEADFACESFARLSETMFDFMPSSVEVVEPSKIDMDLHEATALLNNISGRMHRYDEIAKVAGARLHHMNAQLQLAQKLLMEKDAEIVKLSEKKTAKKKTAKKKK